MSDADTLTPDTRAFEPDAPLTRLQQAFGSALLQGGTAPAGLFHDPDGLASQRLALYRGNLATNWHKALEAACPVFKAQVGDEFFHALARDYARRCPNPHGDLNQLGAGLADFVAEFPPLAAYPWMSDLVRLEWALHRAHHAADAALLTAEALLADADRLEQRRLVLAPAVTLLASSWAIEQIWQAHQSERTVAMPADPASACRLAVSRPRWQATVTALPHADFVAISALRDGTTLGDALDRALDHDPDFDPARRLPTWLAAGLFADRTDPDNHQESQP